MQFEKNIRPDIEYKKQINDSDIFLMAGEKNSAKTCISAVIAENFANKGYQVVMYSFSHNILKNLNFTWNTINNSSSNIEEKINFDYINNQTFINIFNEIIEKKFDKIIFDFNDRKFFDVLLNFMKKDQTNNALYQLFLKNFAKYNFIFNKKMCNFIISKNIISILDYLELENLSNSLLILVKSDLSTYLYSLIENKGLTKKIFIIKNLGNENIFEEYKKYFFS